MSIGTPAKVQGFTFVELMILLMIISVLGLFVLSALAGADAKARRLSCIENLDDMYRALSGLSSENQGRLPVGANDPNPALMFDLLQMETPRYEDWLHCPSDTSGRPMLSSYFITLEAETPRWIAGDRNLETNAVPLSGVVKLNRQATPYWGRNLHSARGNLVSDSGAVESVGNRRMGQQWKLSGGTATLLMP